ncbi:iron-siderophore ABC transporter substrate-binding protein [Lyngbya confervoides]|uniref:Iron-siderophore ABC transporter substrate-binding protein n=1 Tax=Lyngbya confervoides BDU141951 TaxID=1574623 RepID=A0ABD4T2L8_9CYAN|nr:iron-siderophore ABC transporter substrate-binding protein [Lyngbya confervoides]MCM1982899.1 iron-siderophore ABC transporter substrate-binding protein [Lyngbya confervoides BDU141951]
MLLAFGVAACQPQSVTDPPTDPTCRWVDHAAGKTCVPGQVQRLVTLDTVSFEHAIALGLKPLGTVDVQRLDAHLQSHLTDVVDVGQSEGVNLERVLALKPDLILGLDYHQEIYNRATQVAPTVLINFEHSGQWKDVFKTYAQVLNRVSQGEQALQAYRDRIQQFQQQLASQLDPDPLSSLQVSVIRIYPDSVNLYFRDSFPGTILQDAGLSRPPAQNLSADEANRRYQNPIQAALSLERFDQADGDVLFIWTAENTAEANQEARSQLSELQRDPLWQRLKAVQRDRVYQVPSYWIGSGPIAATAIVEDLFQVLVNREPTGRSDRSRLPERLGG